MAKQAKQKKKPGRPSKLTPETTAKICSAIRAGNYFETACVYGGISKSTGHAWLAIAKGENPDVPASKAFTEFLDAVEKAKAEAEIAAIARIQKAARGGEVLSRVTKTTTRTIKRKNGDVEEVTTTETAESMLPPQWQADAWWAERTAPDKWGRRIRQEVSGPNGGPVKTEGTGGGQVYVLLPDNGRGDVDAIPEGELPVIVPGDERPQPAAALPDNGREPAGQPDDAR